MWNSSCSWRWLFDGFYCFGSLCVCVLVHVHGWVRDREMQCISNKQRMQKVHVLRNLLIHLPVFVFCFFFSIFFHLSLHPVMWTWFLSKDDGWVRPTHEEASQGVAKTRNWRRGIGHRVDLLHKHRFADILGDWFLSCRLVPAERKSFDPSCFLIIHCSIC